MAESLKFTAKLRAKGLDNTGFTEAHAKRAAGRLGSTQLLIIEVEADAKVTDAEGDEQVMLKVISAEPVPADQENAVREFVRAIARQRRVDDGQLEIGDDEPGAADAVTNAVAGLAAATDVVGEATGVVMGPSPGCVLPEGHDGDHDIWDGNPDAPVEGQGPADPSNVVEFSGKA